MRVRSITPIRKLKSSIYSDSTDVHACFVVQEFAPRDAQNQRNSAPDNGGYLSTASVSFAGRIKTNFHTMAKKLPPVWDVDYNVPHMRAGLIFRVQEA